MEAVRKRNIRSGIEYDRYFDTATGKNDTVKKGATLSDTVRFIPEVVRKTQEQTSQIAKRLKGRTTYETCSNIWQFVYNHIQYKKDEKGYEQIRSPRRTWHDRRQGVDCDCYSVFISGILTNLGIPHILRITKYKQDHFQHIYPVVPYNGSYIILDCVTDYFNYEVPFSDKKDYPMDLQFLDGIPGYDDGMDELGKLLKKAKKKAGATAGNALLQKLKAKVAAKKALAPAATLQPGASAPPPPKKKKKGLFKKIGKGIAKIGKKVLHVVNKINPVTLLLRNGLLAAMKLNVSNVAKRMRWGYLTAEQAAAKGVDPERFKKLLATRQKLEKIFYGAGGKPANLKKAILTGKGNKDKQVVAGLEGLGSLDFTALDYMDVYTPLPQLLGPDIYYSENVQDFNGVDALDGLGDLGEPISMASITAAMGAIKIIAGNLKKIGSIFKSKGQEGAEDFDEAINEAAENNQPVPDTTPVPAMATNPILPESLPAVSTSNAAYVAPESEVMEDGQEMLPVTTNNQVQRTDNEIDISEESTTTATTSTTGNNSSGQKESFWDKNKKWLKPTLIAGGGVAVIAIGYAVYNKSKTKNKSSPQALSGFSGNKRKNHGRVKHGKKKAVALI